MFPLGIEPRTVCAAIKASDLPTMETYYKCWFTRNIGIFYQNFWEKFPKKGKIDKNI